MNIIPPYISKELKKRDAERKVLKAFKKIEIPFKSFLFHSVNLPEHQYKEWGEIDFLLISKKENRGLSKLCDLAKSLKKL